jgi:Flp pilus assembly protein TadG
MMPPRARKLLSYGRRFARDRRGVSAIEFALVAPLMIALYIGMAEVTEGTAIDRQITQTARAVGDLASQANLAANYDINSTQLANILTAANAMMYPNATTSLQVTVTGISVAANGTATVLWSGANANATALTKGSTLTVPSGLKIANTASQLIWAKVTWPYTPNLGYTITGTINLSDQFYVVPRQATTITCSGCQSH